MGIYNFQRWLREKKLIVPLKASTHLSTDLLALDFHFVLHQCIYKCKNILEFRERIFIFLDKLIKKIKFKKLGLFFDGSAPKAKYREQLRRSKKKKYKNPDENHLESDILHPGNHQLLLLEIHLKNYFIEKKIDYFFSSSSRNGEGEIKIIKWLKTPEFKFNNKILFGGDSDLLPIAASLGQNTIVILVNNSKWATVKISRVISVFLQRETPKEERIREFVAMCILLGNDYIPKIRGIGFTTLIRANKYRKGGCLIEEDFYFNKNALKLLLCNIKPASVNNLDEREPKEYLHGLNWCAHLYLGGICKDYNYSYDFRPPWLGEMIKIL